MNIEDRIFQCVCICVLAVVGFLFSEWWNIVNQTDLLFPKIIGIIIGTLTGIMLSSAIVEDNDANHADSEVEE